MPDKAKIDAPKARQKRAPGPALKVVPGYLQPATLKAQGETHAAQIPKRLDSPTARAALAQQLMASGVASGVSTSADDVLVSVEGHRAVRLNPSDWLVVTADGVSKMTDAAFRAAYDVEDLPSEDAHAEPPRSDGDAPVTDLTPQVSPVVTT